MKWSIILFCVLAVCGCAGVQVSQDYDDAARFSGLRSYEWKQQQIEGEDFRERDPLLHKRFRAAIERTLQEKGFVRREEADFRVGYDFYVSSRIESDPIHTSFGLGWGSYRRFGGIGFGAYPDVRQYDLGILVINIYDARSGELIWRGKGSERITVHSTPQQLSDFANDTVDAVLAQFPPF